MSIENKGREPGSFRVHALVPESFESANLWAWYSPDGGNAFEPWPGRAMEREEGGGFFCDVPSWANSVIISGNDGKCQTGTMSVDCCDVWVKIAEDLSFNLSYSCPDKTEIYALIPGNWHDAFIWAWSFQSGRNVSDKWPGAGMECRDGVYKAEIPAWADRIIISSPAAGIQTGDIKTEPCKSLYIEINDEGGWQSSDKMNFASETPCEDKQDKKAEVEALPEKYTAPVTAEASKKEAQCPEAEPYNDTKPRSLLPFVAAVFLVGAVLIFRKRRRK